MEPRRLVSRFYDEVWNGPDPSVIPQLFQAFLRRMRSDNFVPTMFEKIAQGEEHGLFIFDQ